MRGATEYEFGDDIAFEISTHAPRERCDAHYACSVMYGKKFLLTHPVRGATAMVGQCLPSLKISTHAPRERCDNTVLEQRYSLENFYSRTP